MLHAAIVRSPHAHARIGGIDASRALEAPGVAGVVTFADLGEAARPLPVVPPHAALRGKNFHLLAGDRARFVGEAVAVVVADSRYAAEDARALIDVAWEPLPSVQEATAPGAARVHDDLGDNLAGRVRLSRGDVTAALQSAPRRASLTLHVGRAGGQPMETRGLVAEYNTAAELLTVWASSQVPHQVRQFICDVLGLEPHRVRVVAPDVGGGFGAKLIVYPEDVLIPFLALRFGRPVRWLEDRLEHMLTATQERTQVHTVEVGFDDGGDYPAVLRRALDMADYDRLAKECRGARVDGRVQGVGVACYVELTGVGPFEGATVRADAAGRITVFTGVPSQGQGLETTLAQVAADELGVTPDEITVIGGDTLGIGQGVGTFASRAAVVGGTAVALASRELRAKATRLAAQALGIAADEVQQHGKLFAERANPEHRIELGRLAAVAAMATASHGVAPGLEATHFFQPPGITYASGAPVALVQVDPDTMHVRLSGYWVSHDSGRLINPTIVEGQIQGAVALGIGSALLEEVRYDSAGQALSASFMDYALPRGDDIPPIEIDHLETPSPLNPLGLKGVGESGTLPVAAVVASAVEDALSAQGVRVAHVPLTPRRLQTLESGGKPRWPPAS